MTAAQPQACEISHRDGRTTVRLSGVVDAVGGLVDVVKSAAAPDRPVEVDLTDARLVDWSGVGFLARLVVALRPARVTVSGAGPQVREMITESGLDRHLVLREVDPAQAHATVDIVDLSCATAPVVDVTDAEAVRWSQHC